MASEGGGWDLSTLVEELTEGEDRVRQLGECLDEHSSPEQRRQLVQQVQASFQRAISMAKAFESDRLLRLQASADSPRSLSGRSDNSDRAASKEQERREMCKKRKTLQKWTTRVRVALDGGGGATDGLDDGHSWRKYGQKEILGARHPRGYFRCTHRNTAGCLAMKQVQRSDEDPSVFDVTYRGEHTCSSQKPQKTSQDPGLLLSFQPSLKIKTEGSALEDRDRSSPFSFPSTPVSSFMSESNLFSSPPAAALEAGLTGEFCPPFTTSPATPEPMYFSPTPWQVGEAADLADVVSSATTWTRSSSAMGAAASWGDPTLGFDCFEHLP